MVWLLFFRSYHLQEILLMQVFFYEGKLHLEFAGNRLQKGKIKDRKKYGVDRQKIEGNEKQRDYNGTTTTTKHANCITKLSSG